MKETRTIKVLNNNLGIFQWITFLINFQWKVLIINLAMKSSLAWSGLLLSWTLASQEGVSTVP